MGNYWQKASAQILEQLGLIYTLMLRMLSK